MQQYAEIFEDVLEITIMHLVGWILVDILMASWYWNTNLCAIKDSALSANLSRVFQQE